MLSMATNIEIAVFVIAGFSFFLSLYVVTTLRWIRASTFLSKCILYLHITQLIEDVASLPFVFTSDSGFCSFIGVLYYFGSLGNVCACGAMNLYLYDKFFSQNPRLESNKFYWLEIFVFVFPLITLLPLSTDSYGETTGRRDFKWCSMSSNGYWSVVVLYSWAWLILLLLIITFVVNIVSILKKTKDRDLAIRLFTTVGIYPLITLSAWVPRTLRRVAWFMGVNGDIYMLFNFPIYICGILYTIVFLKEESNLKEYEKQTTILEETSISMDMHNSSDLDF